MEVRDPIHGAIRISGRETLVVDHPFVQRLRDIRQTGFSYLPFPGATHSRYSHCIGVMELAGRAFDSAYSRWDFTSSERREELRAAVRLAALCHDLGHAPFSHCTEFAMPKLTELGIRFYPEPSDRYATHEDYTIAILERSTLADVVAREFSFTTRHVAALIHRDVDVDDDFFVDGGLDHRRALSQLVSSELDCDRMDYLVRDSYYSGARYGAIDVDWLISNLIAHPIDGEVGLGLDESAIYAFDDFLVARHHMFLMVYFHHNSVIYEEMLRRWVTSPENDWAIPASLDEYLEVDDVALSTVLRTASDEFARRLVEKRPYRRVVERHGTPEEVDLSGAEETLLDAGIDVIHSTSTGRLSRYTQHRGKRESAPSIQVLKRGGGPILSPLTDASRIFDRYKDARRIARLYVRPEERERAMQVLGLG
ncbi:MAG: HD domain-containing protein [Deltaproteobacteria bacterium]|nr:MAG: HD domain-containing protein [Deltaproteobacteria bacterium]